MAGRIPMPIADIRAEAMQKCLVLLGKSLQLGRERYHLEPFSLADRFNPVVGIKKISYTKALHEMLAGIRTRQDLRAIA